MGRAPKNDLPADLRKILVVVGANIRSQRQRLGITQAKLARASKVSLATLNEIETKCSRDIRLSTLVAIAAQLEIELPYLLLDSDLKENRSQGDQAQFLKASDTLNRLSKKFFKKSDLD